MSILNQEIRNVPLAEIQEHPNNARKGDMGAIQSSVDENGFWGTIVVQKSTGFIVAGNHRYRAAKEAGFKEVPVAFVDVDDTKAKKILAADNRTSDLGDYDNEALAHLLDDLNADEHLAGTGYNVEDLDDLINGLSKTIDVSAFKRRPPQAKEETEPVPEPPKKPITKPGDIWQLGDHRVMCGDSTNLATEFISGCDALVFDPPWDAGIAMSPMGSTLAFCDGQRVADIVAMFGAPSWAFVWDCVSSWYTPNRPLRRMKMCLWYGDLSTYDANGSHYGDSGSERVITNTRGTYVFQPDPRGKHLSDVFSSPITQLHRDNEHSHLKPLDWVRMLIANCTRGDVYDPFAGSGTTVIACEQIGRRCVAVEIDPAYCDVIVERWENLTGQKATRLPT